MKTKKFIRKRSVAIFAVLLLVLTSVFVVFAFSNRTNYTTFAQSSQDSVHEDFTFTRIANPSPMSGINALSGNGNRQVNVRLRNRALREAVVPAYIQMEGNTYVVTEIATNGFSAATNLRHITIPNTVRRINNTAFMNNQNLESIHLPHGIEHIGANVFSGNRNLQRIVIPSSVTHIGASILINGNPNARIYVRTNGYEDPTQNWAANWNVRQGANRHPVQLISRSFLPDNWLHTYFEYDENGHEVGLIVYNNSLWLNSYYLNPVIPYELEVFAPNANEYRILPIVKIDNGAFGGAQFNTLTVDADPSNRCITLDSLVFNFASGNYIAINRPIQYAESLDPFSETGAMFDSTAVNYIFLPDCLDEISYAMFRHSVVQYIGFRNVRDGDFSTVASDQTEIPYSVTRLGEQAFKTYDSPMGQIGISRLVIPQTVKYVGFNREMTQSDSIIEGWAYPQQVHVFFNHENYSVPNASDKFTTHNWAPNWAVGAGANVIDFERPSYRRIILDPQGGEGGSEYFYVLVDGVLPADLEAPTRFGHELSGFYCADGTRFFGPNMKVVYGNPWTHDIERMYARWTPNTFTIHYSHFRGGSIVVAHEKNTGIYGNNVRFSVFIDQRYMASWQRGEANVRFRLTNQNGSVVYEAGALHPVVNFTIVNSVMVAFEIENITPNSNNARLDIIVDDLQSNYHAITFNWRDNSGMQSRVVDVVRGENLNLEQIPIVADTFTEGFSHWLINGRTYTNAQLTQRNITGDLVVNAVMFMNIRRVNFFVNGALTYFANARHGQPLALNAIPNVQTTSPSTHHVVWRTTGNVLYTRQQLSNRPITAPMDLVAVARSNTFNINFQLGYNQIAGSFSTNFGAATIGQPLNPPLFTTNVAINGFTQLTWYFDRNLTIPVNAGSFQLPPFSNGATITLFARVWVYHNPTLNVTIEQEAIRIGLRNSILITGPSIWYLHPDRLPHGTEPWPWRWPHTEPDLISRDTIIIRDVNTGMITGTFDRNTSVVTRNSQNQMVISNGVSNQVISNNNVIMFNL